MVPRECQNTPNFAKLVTTSKEQIDQKAYSYSVLWDTPVVKQLNPRPSPELLPAEGLRGAAGVGTFGTSGGTAKPQRHR